jgi:iron complex outermembrane receptor protein
MMPNLSRLALAVAAALLSTTTPGIRAEDNAQVLSRFELSTPTVVVERDAIEASGLGSLGEVIERLVVSGTGLNRRFNGGGNGTVQADLRELGANRTLVLVDGRRWFTDLDGSTDLGSIPLASVARIEVYTGAEGARFGANAVAGAINIITRRGFEGLSVDARIGEYAEGDGQEQSASFALGSTSDRAQVSLIASYDKQEPVSAGARSFSATPFPGLSATDVNAGASSTTPFGRFGTGFGATTLTLIPGRSGANAGDFRPFDLATDGFNLLPDNYLLTPSERTAVFFAGRYALTDAIAFRSEVLVNERRSEQRFAGFPLLFGFIATGAANEIRIPASNAFNPFGAAVTRAQFRPANAPRRFRQDTDSFSFRAGFDGAFEAFARSWQWTLDSGYADSETASTSSGLFDVGRLALGLGPSFRDPGGTVRCGTPTATIAACVPINLFGGPTGFTDAMRDYAAFVAQESRYTEQQRYAASLATDLIELPAGPLGVVAGYDYRRESGFDQPDALVLAGGAGTPARAPLRGAYALDEFHLAFNLPLLADAPLADSLTLELAARHSDYASFDATSPRVALRWQPIADLSVYGAYDEGLREPSLVELFEPQRDEFIVLLDPCDRRRGFPSDAVRDRCLNGFAGLPPVPTTYSLANQYRVTAGGNPDLRSERATSRRLGLEWRPTAFDGLAVAMDWYRVRIDDRISVGSAQQLVNACYLDGRVAACQRIERGGDDFLFSDIFVGYQNLFSSTLVEGWDLAIAYPIDTRFGRFGLSTAASYLSYYGDAERDDGDNRAGLFVSRGLSFPRLRANFGLDWARGDYGASLAARYRSALDESCVAVLTSRPQLCSDPEFRDPQFIGQGMNRQDSQWVFDLQGRWEAPWNARVTLGVRNLADEAPPRSLAPDEGNYDPALDPGGRFWYLGYTQRF